MINILKLMIPFTPHLAYECLELLNCKTINQWPRIDDKNVLNFVKFAVQINGKTRDIIEVEKNLNEENIKKIIFKKSKANKHLDGKKIVKTIFISNKIINFII